MWFVLSVVKKRYDKEDSKDKIYEKELKSFDGTTIMR